MFDLADLHPQVFYELGIALTLGTPVVLVAPDDTRLPFDVAQNVQLYAGPGGLTRLLGDEIDVALYTLQIPPSAESSLPATLGHAETLAARHALPFAAPVLDRMRAAVDDAARFVAALKTFNGMLGADEHEIVLSRWPGCYPPSVARRWLGRPTVLIAQEGTERLLPARLPAVAKWRCHTYAADAPVFGGPVQAALAAALGVPLSRRL